MRFSTTKAKQMSTGTRSRDSTGASTKLTVAKIQESLANIFNSAQQAAAAHASCCRDLRKLQLVAASSGLSVKFRKYFESMLNTVLAIFKHEQAVERVIGFVVKFATFVPAGSSSDSAAAAEIKDFAEYLIQYLVDCSTAGDKAVRYRSCQLLASLIGHAKTLSTLSSTNSSSQSQTDATFNFGGTVEALRIRIEDKIPQVRFEAAKALLALWKQNETPNLVLSQLSCTPQVLESLLEAVETDPEKDIRKLIVSELPITEQTIPFIVHRTRDVHFEVRQAAFRALGARVGPQRLSMSDRISALSEGIRDRSNETVAECLKMCEKWQRSVGGDLITLLNLLDVEKTEDVIQDLLRKLFKEGHLNGQKFKYEEALKIPPRMEDFTPELALLWRCFAEYAAQDLQPPSVAEAVLDTIIPELSRLTRMMIEVLGLEDEQLRLELRPVQARSEFVLKQILLVCLSSADFRCDEVGRGHMTTLMRLLIRRSDLSSTIRPMLVKVLARTQENPQHFIEVVTDIISDLHDEEQESFSFWSLALSTIEALLSITFQRVPLEKLRGLENSVIFPACQSEEPKVRQQALHCMGLLCLQDVNFARRYRLLLLSVLEHDVPSLKLAAIQILFDVLCVHGVSKVCDAINSSAEPSSSTANELLQKAEPILETLVEYLSESDAILRLAATEGVCKLLFLGRVTQSQLINKILSRLVVELFSPMSERYTKVRICIQSFMLNLLRSADVGLPDARRLLETATVSAVREIIRSKPTTSLYRTSLNQLGQYMFKLFDCRETAVKKTTPFSANKLELDVPSIESIFNLTEGLLGEARRQPTGRGGSQLPILVSELLLNESTMEILQERCKKSADHLVVSAVRRVRYLIYRLAETVRDKHALSMLDDLKQKLEKIDQKSIHEIARERAAQREIHPELEESIIGNESVDDHHNPEVSEVDENASVVYSQSSKKPKKVYSRRATSQPRSIDNEADLFAESLPPATADAASLAPPTQITLLPEEPLVLPPDLETPPRRSTRNSKKLSQPVLTPKESAALASKRAFFDELDKMEVPEIAVSKMAAVTVAEVPQIRSSPRKRKREERPEFNIVLPEREEAQQKKADEANVNARRSRVSVSPDIRTKEIQRRLRGEVDEEERHQQVQRQQKVEQMLGLIKQLEENSNPQLKDTIDQLKANLNDLVATTTPQKTEDTPTRSSSRKKGKPMPLEMALFLAKTPATEQKMPRSEADDAIDPAMSSPSTKRLKKREQEEDISASLEAKFAFEPINTPTSAKKTAGKRSTTRRKVSRANSDVTDNPREEAPKETTTMDPEVPPARPKRKTRSSSQEAPEPEKPPTRSSPGKSPAATSAASKSAVSDADTMPPPPPVPKRATKATTPKAAKSTASSAAKKASSAGPKIVRSGKIGRSLLFGGTAKETAAGKKRSKSTSDSDDEDQEGKAADNMPPNKKQKLSDEDSSPTSNEGDKNPQTSTTIVPSAASTSVTSPPPRAQRGPRAQVVAFTGFSDRENPTEPMAKYNNAYKAKLEEMAKSVGLNVASGENIDSTVTHVVSPPGTRTLKTIAACLGMRWLLDPSWLERCAAENRIVSESDAGGVRLSQKPLAGKSVFISPGFKTHRAFNQDHFAVLIERLGKGQIVQSPFGADILLIGSTADDADNYSLLSTKKLVWNEFFDLIQPLPSNTAPASQTSQPSQPITAAPAPSLFKRNV